MNARAWGERSGFDEVNRVVPHELILVDGEQPRHRHLWHHLPQCALIQRDGMLFLCGVAAYQLFGEGAVVGDHAVHRAAKILVYLAHEV